VIDLSDPTSPEVLGELVMPGFSTYLHQVGEDLLLGLGREDGSLKVALYDVSDPTDPVELAKYVPDDAYVNTVAEYDHKAFLFDQASGRVIVPAYYSDWMVEDGSYDSWAGFIVFSVGEEEGVELVGWIMHDYTGMRSLIIGDVLYTISCESVKANDLLTLDPIGSVDYGEFYYYYGI
jgi:inhibitor of cysteine peptidase